MLVWSFFSSLLTVISFAWCNNPLDINRKIELQQKTLERRKIERNISLVKFFDHVRMRRINSQLEEYKASLEFTTIDMEPMEILFKIWAHRHQAQQRVQERILELIERRRQGITELQQYWETVELQLVNSRQRVFGASPNINLAITLQQEEHLSCVRELEIEASELEAFEIEIRQQFETQSSDLQRFLERIKTESCQYKDLLERVKVTFPRLINEHEKMISLLKNQLELKVRQLEDRYKNI